MGQSAAVNLSTSYTISITVTSGITGVDLSNTAYTGSAANAGAVIGHVTVTSNGGGTVEAQVTLGGADAARFSLTGGGNAPCDLAVGAADLDAGDYDISLSVAA